MSQPIAPSITDEQLDELERMAKSANQSGWYWDDKTVDDEGYTHIPECSYLTGSICLADNYEGYQEDCNFIEAASPKAIRDLITRLRAAEKDAERYIYLKGQGHFRAMSIDMGGNHSWTGMGRAVGKGPTVDEAIDAAMERQL